MKKLKSYFSCRNYPALKDLQVLLILFGTAFFLFLGKYGLIEPDEGRYSEIPREMLEKGDFLTPTLNYVSYFEKPPLHYWLNALFLKLFGLNEFAARFAGALAGVLCVLLVYHTGRKLFGRREGLFSALILGSSTGFLAQSRINLTDMTLTFWLSAALCCFIIASADQEQYKRRYYYLFFLFSALAVLTKGLIGVLFPAGIVFLYLVLARRLYLLKEMQLPGGIALFLITAAPWFVLVSWHNPEFPRFFFIHEHFERFLTKVHRHYQPAWFFIPILLMTMFPWSIYLARAIGKVWKERRHPDGDRLLFLVIWAACILLFFSASQSKLIPYILPLFPPLALLLGKTFSDLMEREQEQFFLPEIWVLGPFLIVLPAAALIYPHLPDIAPALIRLGLVASGSSILTKQPILSPMGGVVAACLVLFMGAVTRLAHRRKDILMLFIGLCFGSYLLETISLQLFMENIEFKKSSKELALLAAESLADTDSLVSFGYEQSLPFYTGRRVVVVGGMGELDFGSRQGDHSAWFIDEPAFMRLWQEKPQVVVLLKKADYEKIAGKLVPAASILGQKGKKMLICKKSIANVAVKPVVKGLPISTPAY